MSVIEKLQWRYATKKFDSSKKLSESQLNTLKEAFNLTALSYGLQTLKLVIVEDNTTRKQLVESAYGQKQVVDASHLLVLCIQSEINERDVDAYFTDVQSIRKTPSETLQPFKNQLISTLAQMPDSKKVEWATKQAYIALGNLMTVCAIEQIDSCPMEGFNPAAFDELLNLSAHGLKSVLLLPVGFRAEDDMFAGFKKVRKLVAHTVVEL